MAKPKGWMNVGGSWACVGPQGQANRNRSAWLADETVQLTSRLARSFLAPAPIVITRPTPHPTSSNAAAFATILLFPELFIYGIIISLRSLKIWPRS